ncbi:DNA-binding CsgD family transcriptional regulator [Lipingzhangella halophila]|uniref:DNA-binding CsgD family transcriptional regulator n=1 Tax=Lipingzhangella halophila TaxID=1783352 RepID=A0A7W7RN28_9ACTN|nr:helix-turn-helix transcriptional regulator [Lipingzhangella halophila]MBB4934481.1 DNA-binding CsgD family transcriptional regulator [Lipingzhangella halophila]
MAEESTEQIRGALLGLRHSSGIPVLFGGASADTGQVRITELIGTLGDTLRGLRIVPGRGVGGKAMAAGEIALVTDYLSSTAISHEYDGPVAAEGLASVAAVPIVVRRRLRGVLYGALRQPRALGDRGVSTIVHTARDIEQDLAVREEARHRIAESERAATVREASGTGADTARWEEVRALNAELRGLAGQLTDAGLRDQLLDVSTRLTSAVSAREFPHAPRLSRRELDVLACVAVGHTNADAAVQLRLRPETVKSYLRSVMRKLDSHTRMEAVSTARRLGLLA